MDVVSFPSLGLQFRVSRVAFTIFGMQIYTYAVIIAFTLILSIFLGLRHCERYGFRQNDIIDMMIFAIPASILFSRIYYIIFSWDSYRGNLSSILNIRQGGLAIYGAIIGAFAVVFVFCRIRKVNALALLDFGVPYLAMSQAIGRWGNFINQEAFGTNTTLPWGMSSMEITRFLNERVANLRGMGVIVDPSLPVHPAFLYESLWSALLAVLLFWLRRRKRFHGEGLFAYLIGYGLARAAIEGIRVDSLMIGSTSIRASQVLSIVLAVLFAVLLVLQLRKNPERLPWPVAVSLADGDEAALGAEGIEVGEGGEGADGVEVGEGGEAGEAGEAGGVDGFGEGEGEGGGFGGGGGGGAGDEGGESDYDAEERFDGADGDGDGWETIESDGADDADGFSIVGKPGD